MNVVEDGSACRTQRDSSSSSERFMSNGFYRPAASPTIRESFDEVVLPHLDDAVLVGIAWTERTVREASGGSVCDSRSAAVRVPL